MLARILTPILILIAGVAAWHWLSTPIEEPKPEHQARQKLKTERVVLWPTDYQVVLDSQGTVRAHHVTTITPLVPGTISTIHPCFEDGAFFNQGDVLAEIDPADLIAAHTAAESRVARAEANLAQEEARAKQAKLNWQDIGYTEEPSPLVLRIPQLKEARAMLTAAQADLDQASRDLDRAKIRAPFAGRVKSRQIGLGQAVNAATPLGEVFATDFAEVRLPLAPSQLPFVTLPTRAGDPPVEVSLSDALGVTADPAAAQWQAQIVRTEGTLDEASRELFAIARIHDPFGLGKSRSELRIAQPVRAKIQGNTLKGVFVIPRTALRGINTVYLIDQNDPAIIRTELTPIWSNEQVIVVRDGIKPGDWLAVSRLPYAPNGAAVEIIEPAPSAVDAAGRPAAKPANES